MTCITGALAGFLLAFGWAYCHAEMYCFWNPTIDTIYAKGFSEDDFNRIKVGMTLEDVRALMCPPLGVWTNQDGGLCVWYTSDGKCKFGDFAWFARSLMVSNNQVVAIENRIYYD